MTPTSTSARPPLGLERETAPTGPQKDHPSGLRSLQEPAAQLANDGTIHCSASRTGHKPTRSSRIIRRCAVVDPDPRRSPPQVGRRCAEGGGSGIRRVVRFLRERRKTIWTASPYCRCCTRRPSIWLARLDQRVACLRRRIDEECAPAARPGRMLGAWGGERCLGDSTLVHPIRSGSWRRQSRCACRSPSRNGGSRCRWRLPVGTDW